MTGTFIQIVNSDVPGEKRQPMVGNRLSIGRAPDNDIVLIDDLSSRSHAVIECVSGGYFIRDLNSRNGTMVNGEKLAAVRELADGDVIAVGKHRLRLFVSAPAVVEDVEMLTADDLIEEEEEEDTTGDVLPSEYISQDGDVESQLSSLAANLPNGGFTADQIELTDSRGQQVHSEGRRGKTTTPGDAVGILRQLLLVTALSHATDIHIEPRQMAHVIRLRIDGQMIDVASVATAIGLKLTTVVKVLCKIDISQRSNIQEGAFASKVPEAKSPGKFRRIDYRVSFAPAVLGQKLVVRVLDSSGAPTKLSGLGFPKYMLEQVARIIHQDSGMVLVCGPTGSGKTTTLYSLLRSIDLAKRNVVTIEDPVEVHLEGITQIPVDEAHDKSFLQLLRSLLRQDPDVILIGEVRDSETARVAMQAAITGHLVFSTVHTRDTLGTIVRMRDLGVEPYMLAQGLQLVVAQRLVRQLCPFCKRPTLPKPHQLEAFATFNIPVRQIFKAVGCPRCLKTGHSGRRAFFELLVSDEKLGEAITANATRKELLAAVQSNPNFISLKQSAMQLVADGMVAIEEVEQGMGTETGM